MCGNIKYNPKKYFSLTFLITFILWTIGAYYSFENDDSFYMVYMLLGLITPFVVSLIMIYKSNNFYLKKDFFNKLVNIKLINAKFLPFIFLIMPLVVLVSILISLLFGESSAQFNISENFSFSTGVVPVLALFLIAATFEELGWRGYAFESLESRYNFLTASIIFSILWSLWHLPLIYVNNSYQYEIVNQSIFYGINFYISIIPMGIIISWICIKNQKSILSAILFHFIINMSQEVLSMTQFTKGIESAVLFVVVIVIVVMDKELFLSKTCNSSCGNL